LTTKVLLDNEPPLNPRKLTTVSLLSVEPIPLTPEILEKCGFENAIDGMRIELPISDDLKCDNYDLYMSYYSKEFFIAGINENSGFGRMNLKYLHHLQNLYFAMTGEELPISL
jgi:hypothetical protein